MNEISYIFYFQIIKSESYSLVIFLKDKFSANISLLKEKENILLGLLVV